MPWTTRAFFIFTLELPRSVRSFPPSSQIRPWADCDVEPVETIDATRRYARVRADGGDPLEGDACPGGDRIAVAV